MNLSQFTYILDNIINYQPSLITIILGIVIGLVFAVALREAFLYGYGATLVKKDKADIEKKKKTLSDLILMKDIQTELEKEIEQAMLKATFHG